MSNWLKLYSEVKIDDDTILTAQQVKQLQKRNAQLEEENLILKKSDCNLHSTLRQRLNAVKILSSQHSVSILCSVIRVNRSTYYKWFNRTPSTRELENRTIRSYILELYSKTDKRLGAIKITECLRRDYCINISCGRVYHLMKNMNLPKMSTVKPPKNTYSKAVEADCNNLLA